VSTRDDPGCESAVVPTSAGDSYGSASVPTHGTSNCASASVATGNRANCGSASVHLQDVSGSAALHLGLDDDQAAVPTTGAEDKAIGGSIAISTENDAVGALVASLTSGHSSDGGSGAVPTWDAVLTKNSDGCAWEPEMSGPALEVSVSGKTEVQPSPPDEAQAQSPGIQPAANGQKLPELPRAQSTICRKADAGIPAQHGSVSLSSNTSSPKKRSEGISDASSPRTPKRRIENSQLHVTSARPSARQWLQQAAPPATAAPSERESRRRSTTPPVGASKEGAIPHAAAKHSQVSSPQRSPRSPAVNAGVPEATSTVWGKRSTRDTSGCRSPVVGGSVSSTARSPTGPYRGMRSPRIPENGAATSAAIACAAAHACALSTSRGLAAQQQQVASRSPRIQTRQTLEQPVEAAPSRSPRMQTRQMVAQPVEASPSRSPRTQTRPVEQMIEPTSHSPRMPAPHMELPAAPVVVAQHCQRRPEQEHVTAVLYDPSLIVRSPPPSMRQMTSVPPVANIDLCADRIEQERPRAAASPADAERLAALPQLCVPHAATSSSGRQYRPSPLAMMFAEPVAVETVDSAFSDRDVFAVPSSALATTSPVPTFSGECADEWLRERAVPTNQTHDGLGLEADGVEQQRRASLGEAVSSTATEGHVSSDDVESDLCNRLREHRNEADDQATQVHKLKSDAESFLARIDEVRSEFNSQRSPETPPRTKLRQPVGPIKVNVEPWRLGAH